MSRPSFFISILTLLALEVGTITLAYYSSVKFKKDVGARMEMNSSAVAVAPTAPQPEVRVLWTPQESALHRQYQVIRHSLSNDDAPTVIATIDPTDISYASGYLQVNDRDGAGGNYYYQVVDIADDGARVVTSVALII